METHKCTLLICQGTSKPQDEKLQQEMTLRHTRQMKSPRHQSSHLQEQDAQPRSVFSFRLNYSRNFSDSDKCKSFFTEEPGKQVRPCTPILNCKSAERPPFHLIHQPTPHTGKTRHFTSPLQRTAVVHTPMGQQNMPANTLGKRVDWKQQQGRQLIRFNSVSTVTFNQALDNKSKNSAVTQNSSIHSQTEPNGNQQKMANPHPLLNPSQDTHVQHSLTTQKGPLANSLLSKSNKSIEQQIVYPSFDQLQNIQPRNFFANANTIKTIFTSNELRDNSADHSFKAPAPQPQQMDGSDVIEFAEQRVNRHQFLTKNRKRTAYFGCIEQDTQENIQVSRFKEPQFIPQGQAQNSNLSKHYSHQQKRVQFQAAPPLSSSIVATRQNLFENAQVFTIKHIKNERKECQPSLHNIVLSKRVQHKISIQNSIKEVPLITPLADNAYRFKYVNTIKSIGGQSLRSDHSFLDVKFMQNVNKRAPIVKLLQ